MLARPQQFFTKSYTRVKWDDEEAKPWSIDVLVVVCEPSSGRKRQEEMDMMMLCLKLIMCKESYT
jgi:hypothetical protein